MLTYFEQRHSVITQTSFFFIPDANSIFSFMINGLLLEILLPKLHHQI